MEMRIGGRGGGASLEEVEHEQPSWLSKVCCVHSFLFFPRFHHKELWKRGVSDERWFSGLMCYTTFASSCLCSGATGKKIKSPEICVSFFVF